MKETTVNKPRRTKAQIILAVAERLAKEKPSGDTELALGKIHEMLASKQYARNVMAMQAQRMLASRALPRK